MQLAFRQVQYKQQKPGISQLTIHFIFIYKPFLLFLLLSSSPKSPVPVHHYLNILLLPVVPFLLIPLLAQLRTTITHATIVTNTVQSLFAPGSFHSQELSLP